MKGGPGLRAYGHLDSAARAEIWKTSTVPLLYDWLSSRKFSWPHAALQFGEEVKRDQTRVSHRQNGGLNCTTRSMYLAERTGDGSEPNTLLQCSARITIENTCKSEEVAKPWLDECASNARNDGISTPEFSLRKRLVHPGEVNKIRSLMPGVVVTHTDSPELFVWDFGRQPHRNMDDRKDKPNTPDCTLVGHTKSAEYAISVASPSTEPESADDVRDAWVASGGTDCSILVWRLADYSSHGKSIQAFATMKPALQRGDGTTGHTETVEDVSFCGKDRNLIASVGRDSNLLLWDVRKNDGPAGAVCGAHSDDINSVDFGGVNGNLIVTGGSDMHIKVWDNRKLVDSTGKGTPVGDYLEHTEQVNSVMWNTFVPNVFASSSEDGQVLIWDTSATKAGGSANLSCCPELLFRHVGHNLEREKATIMDFHWLPDETDPWCIATISETIGGEGGGSTLQIWRMSTLISSPRDQVASQLRTYGSFQT